MEVRQNMGIYYLEKDKRNLISKFFIECEDTLVWSCLQGYMGEAWEELIQNVY